MIEGFSHVIYKVKKEEEYLRGINEKDEGSSNRIMNKLRSYAQSN